MSQADPLQSITAALRPIISPMGIDPNKVMLGWPQPKFFQVDGNLPALAIFSVSDSGKNVVSRENVHAVVKTGLTAMVYKEALRKTYLLQFSLFAYTPEDRSNIGWSIEQYLSSNPQLQIGIPGVETAIFKYKGHHDAPGEAKFFQRDINYEVTARVLVEASAYLAKTVTMNDNPQIL
ncbi:MAG: hypothetical protein JWN30_198 [Bacilli bacterium]|nr:hypothetical protein [Bacilli bacterium]